MKPLTTTNNTSIALNGSIAVSEIGFDFDGVIADTAEAFIRIACEKYGYCSYTKEDITNFELENCIDIGNDIVEEIFTTILLDSVGTKLQPMKGAIDTLTELTDHSDITIITARPVHQPVIDWLELFFDYDAVGKIKVVATGDHNDKVRHINGHGIRYFIDDRATTCMQLADANITPIVFSQPWNQERHNFQAVSSWDEIRSLIRLDDEEN